MSDQPFGDEETKLGATNRARAAYDAALKLSLDSGNMAELRSPKPDFSVGLEGGIEIIDGKNGKELWCMAFMVVVGSGSEKCTSCKHADSTYIASANGNTTREIIGVAKTASFQLPREISHLVLDKKIELGDADDQVFNRVNSKQGTGTVGILTKSMITRTHYYEHAIKLALVPFTWPEHYI